MEQLKHIFGADDRLLFLDFFQAEFVRQLLPNLPFSLATDCILSDSGLKATDPNHLIDDKSTYRPPGRLDLVEHVICVPIRL